MVNFMKTVIFLPSDEIIRQGDKGTRVYFIARGKVEVFIGPDEEVTQADEKISGDKGSIKSFNSKSIKS